MRGLRLKEVNAPQEGLDELDSLARRISRSPEEIRKIRRDASYRHQFATRGFVRITHRKDVGVPLSMCTRPSCQLSIAAAPLLSPSIVRDLEKAVSLYIS